MRELMDGIKGAEKALDRLKEMRNGWYGSLDDIVDELRDAGFSVEDVNSEYITMWGEVPGTGDDVFWTLKLGGTERTIIITGVEWEVM